MTKGRIFLTVLVGLVVVGALAMALKPHPPPAMAVTTAVVKKGSLTRTVSAAGHLQARETVKISSNISGDLLSLAVKEGERVRRGQVLGQIDRRLQEAAVAQYRGGVASARSQIDQISSNLSQLNRDLERTRQLAKQNLASPAEVEKALTAVQIEQGRLAGQRQLVAQGQGQLETALYNLSRSTLVAPMDGTILEIPHKVGERIRGSDLSEDVVMLMGGLTDMEVKAEVGEHEVVGIHVGDEASVEIDAIPDHQFKGRVAAVSKNAQIKNPGTDAEVTTFFVRVALDQPPEGALPGMSSAVSISTATHENVMMVPIQALASREAKKHEEKGPQREGVLRTAEANAAPAGQPRTAGDVPSNAKGKAKQVKVVFVMKDGKAEMREVHTGLASRTDVEILDGLSDGETIVEGPYRVLARELQDGQAIRVEQAGGKGGGERRPGGPS